MKKDYIFTSARLGFRFWKTTDLEAMHNMNADKEVMRFFENTKTKEESAEMIQKLIKIANDFGYCFYAVEELASQEVIGFIGFNYINYEASFTPAVEIGWRLQKQFWNKGYATEGAKRCLEYGFETLGFEAVVATTPHTNLPSENVMKKIGMEMQSTFNHPFVSNSSGLNPSVLYKIKKPAVKNA